MKPVMNKITTLLIRFIFILLVGPAINSNAQTTTTEIPAKGVFKTIDVERHNKAIGVLNSDNKEAKQQTVSAILANPNYYNPPVIYALSRELFSQGKKDDACYWFYVAQLRARYDANLCMDNSAKEGVAVLNQEYGPDINKYAMQDVKKLEGIVNKVVAFVRNNQENYDHRWLNLHGMWAVEAGLDDKQETRALSEPKDKWPAIKKQTVDDYYSGFIEYVKNKKK
jgi:hypothetical protein